MVVTIKSYLSNAGQCTYNSEYRSDLLPVRGTALRPLYRHSVVLYRNIKGFSDEVAVKCAKQYFQSILGPAQWTIQHVLELWEKVYWVLLAN